jgi:hypothetical protein
MTNKSDQPDNCLDGIPDHIKIKFVEMMTKIDKVESIVNSLERLETLEIQSKVY